MNRPARERAGLWRMLRDVAAAARGFPGSRNVLGAVRFAVIWLATLALIFQTSLAAVSTAANAGQSNMLALSAICRSVDQQDPSDSHDRVAAGHLKCIACVIGHSFAPPSLLMTPRPALAVVGVFYALPFSVPALYTAPYYSHSARGPPAAA
ncbi:DUF2946 family protein [Bradyrhizobium sediminis]|uniref:DUF2946 family protein n=1 Tax=Bradyrhizobium sediminis TaxID=2840469 RepID=A0A975P2D2_9BRAD|nr:DUF2946 family protein [Bradyrhizobium sediminis]QWG25778.1 DUF2946 family protein [Bradyrhizobium sediminis]